MVHVKTKIYTLVFCIIISVWLLLAQVLAVSMLLLACLACFLALVVWSAVKNMAMPVLLFFLPFASLIKLRPGVISMYTVSLIAVLLVFSLRSSKRFQIMHVFPAALLFLETIVVKTVNDYAIVNSYILFFACLLLFPLVSIEKEKEYDFYTLTIFFTVGVVLAALSSKQLIVFPTILRYMSEYGLNEYTRFAGFYGDPNFYAAHITAAISGIVILLFKETKRARLFLLAIMLLLLLYCGFLSISKSFALICVCLLLLGVFELLFRKGKMSAKLLAILTILICGAFVLSSTLFTDLIDSMIARFVSSSGNISDFTTNRSDIWMNYFTEIVENPAILLFGQGMTKILVGNYASHNTLIQAVFQLGIVGLVMLIVWFFAYMRTVLSDVRIKTSVLLQIVILMVGIFGPWMALDLMFFDEFFLLPFYWFIGIRYLSGARAADLK